MKTMDKIVTVLLMFVFAVIGSIVGAFGAVQLSILLSQSDTGTAMVMLSKMVPTGIILGGYGVALLTFWKRTRNMIHRTKALQLLTGFIVVLGVIPFTAVVVAFGVKAELFLFGVMGLVGFPQWVALTLINLVPVLGALLIFGGMTRTHKLKEKDLSVLVKTSH